MKLLSIVTCWCLYLNNELFEFTLHSADVKALLGEIAETAQLHTEVIVVWRRTILIHNCSCSTEVLLL